MKASVRSYLLSVPLVIVAISLLIVSCQSTLTSTQTSKASPTGDPNLTLNHPDEFNWGLFAQINQKAPVQVKAGEQTTNNALWETWANDPCTFPSSPDPAKPPTWDSCADVMTLRTSSQLSAASQGTGETEAGALPCSESNIDPKAPDSNCEQVHRNQSAFDYIIQNKLWYQEGLAEAFKNDLNVSFPIDAVEVKSNWRPLEDMVDQDQSHYHVNYDSQGHTWVLIAMHIMSKAVPNWTWATFEWEGNLGRCDYIGCHDAFGVIPANVASDPQPTPQPYPPGELTPQLLSLFKQYNLGPEWQHYRLKGSQTDFVDATGRTTLLGNSVTENGFIQTSSCITCHSRATVNSAGENSGDGKEALSVFQPTPPAAPAPDTARSYNGVPDPAWFYETDQKTVKNLPVDFVWAIFNASPATPTATPN